MTNLVAVVPSIYGCCSHNHVSDRNGVILQVLNHQIWTVAAILEVHGLYFIQIFRLTIFRLIRLTCICARVDLGSSHWFWLGVVYHMTVIITVDAPVDARGLHLLTYFIDSWQSC